MSVTISPKEFAERYQITRNKVHRWITTGHIRAINVVANPDSSPPRWRITMAEVERFEQSRLSGVAP